MDGTSRADFAAEVARRRAAAGLSLAEVAAAAHVARGHVHNIGHGVRWPSRAVAAGLDTALDADGALLATWEAADSATAAQAVTEASTAEPTGSDALELVDRITRCDVSPATLDLLNRRVDRLCRDYPVRPAPELLADARTLLGRVLVLLGGRTSLAAHRELLVSAGWLSALVACLHWDSGRETGAETWREATASLGAEAGHAQIAAWGHEIAAWMALTASRSSDALVHARAGQELDSTTHVAAQLAAQEARAAAKLGDRRTAEKAMARGRTVLDRLPSPAHPDHHFVIDPAKADFYAVDVYRWLGADDAAHRYAQLVRSHSELADGTIRSPMRRAEALLTLGVVAARRGELDAAVAHGLDGLDGQRRSVMSLLNVAADLDTALGKYRNEPVAAPWRDALRAIHITRSCTAIEHMFE